LEEDKALRKAVAKGGWQERSEANYQVLAWQGGSKTDSILANAADEYAKEI